MKRWQDYDYTPLTRDVSWAEALRNDLTIRVMLGIGTALAIFTTLAAVVFTVTMISFGAALDRDSLTIFVLFVFVPGSAAVGFLLYPSRSRRRYRLKAFAEVNGFGFAGTA